MYWGLYNRFESGYEPVIRLIFYLSAFIMAAQQMLRERPAADHIAKASRQFLAEPTEERLVTLSMLADANSAIMKLTRFLDSEDFDTSRLPHEVMQCADTHHHLSI